MLSLDFCVSWRGQCTWYVVRQRPDLPYFPGASGGAGYRGPWSCSCRIPTLAEAGGVALVVGIALHRQPALAA
jgi:hypothetical protein